MNTCKECIWLNVKDKNSSCADEGITGESPICKYFDPAEQRIIQIRELVKETNDLIDDKRWNWLDDFTASEAFLVCLGAGPWKIKRRTLIQQQAVSALNKRDLSQVDDVSIFQYPLKWQNEKAAAMIDYLKRYKITMTWFVGFISGMREPTKMLYEITKTKGRAKVLDLFIRDYLKAPSFPIDRWVARALKKHSLPLHENYLIELCNKAALDPRLVARQLVDDSGFTGNGKIKAS